MLLKQCASTLAPSLTKIINKSLQTGRLPRQFKKAKIAPVHKAGDPKFAKNYRLISPLPIISKVLEKIISSQLKNFLFENNLLPTAQFAYRAQHSTEDALVYAVNNLLHAGDKGDVSGLVFIN